jgi:hypothetical protein
MDEPRDKPEPEDELDVDAEPLPDRELMSLIDANVVIPVNAAVAANVLSEDSLAAAEAEQDVEIEQTNDERGAS